VIGTISRGAFGKVYKVKKKNTNEIYALKVLPKSQVQHTCTLFTFNKMMLSYCTTCLPYVSPQSYLVLVLWEESIMKLFFNFNLLSSALSLTVLLNSTDHV
jgi:serine/threonine protein kinase